MVKGLFAQGSGTIKGRVVDQATGDPLPGAIVVVVNTSLGASTNLDGQFALRYVPAGTQSLKASYIGYDPITREVTVTENATLEQEFRLTPHAILGKEVVVTAQARGQQSAINQQLAANSILNVVSEERIQELPDFNAAQAISRLPGVSTLQSSGEANKVVIRGLAPQYNEVSVGGISLASTGSSQIGAVSQIINQAAGISYSSISNDRSVDLTMVTPYMVKSIQVYKSLTPDLNANAIGGIVNMSLREAPSGVHGDVLWQSGYTQKSNTYGNYRAVGSISNRFLDDRFGAYILGNAESYDRNADNMNASYETSLLDTTAGSKYNKVKVTNVSLDRHVETRKRYGANLILDYKLPAGILRTINMYSRLKSDYQDYYEILDYKNNVLDLRYRSGPNTIDLGVHSLEFENDFGFMSADLKAGFTYSRNSLPRSPLYQFRQTGGVTAGPIPYNTPPEDLSYQVAFRGDTSAYLTQVSLFSSEYKEDDALAKGDFKVPLNIGDVVSGFFKFGGEYRRGKHGNDQDTPYFSPEGASNPDPAQINRTIMDGIQANFPIMADGTGRFRASNFTNDDGKLYDTFLDDKFGRMFWAASPSLLNQIVDYVRSQDRFNAIHASSINPGGWFDGLYQQLPNDYDYTENYSAGYLMAQMNLGPRLMVVGGARYEKVTSTFHAYNLLDGRDAVHQSFQDTTVHPGNDFWLPMVQAKYSPLDWADVRYSYTQTLARPDYHQLSPHFNMSYDHNNVWAGNPNLKTAQAYNHDAVITLHSNDLGLLSIGGFYKEVKNFTYSTQYKLQADSLRLPGDRSISDFSSLGSPPNASANLYTYVNGRWIAYVKGVEAELQTRFWYLPFPLDGLLLGVNYTHIWSKTRYPFRDAYTIGRPPNQQIVQIDSSRAGRLIDEPNDVANVFVGYDYKGFAARVSFVFQGNSVSSIGAWPEYDGFTEDYYRVDFSARQKLPWSGLEVYLDVNNLNNRQNISKQISIPGFTNQQNYGLTADLGVRFTLER
jgi:TonB-dependent receptor